MEHVIISAGLKNRIATDALNTVDHFILALAGRLTELLPVVRVYTDPQRQGVKLPAVFVAVYHNTTQRGLGGVLAVEYQVEVSYLAKDTLDAGELCGALSAMMEMPHELLTAVGVFGLAGRSAVADAIEGRAQMLCRAEARLTPKNNDVFMQTLEQGVE